VIARAGVLALLQIAMAVHVVQCAEWKNEWHRSSIRGVTWSHDGRCANLDVTNEHLRLDAVVKDQDAYSGTYLLQRQHLLVYATTPECAPAGGAGAAQQTLLSRDVGGTLRGADLLPITLMFGDCNGSDCPSAGISKHRLRWAGTVIETDALLNGGLTTAPFIPQSARSKTLAVARTEAEPVFATIRQIDCNAIYAAFADPVKSAVSADVWVRSCENSAATIGRPEARRLLGEHYFTAGESTFKTETLLRISGVDVKSGQRVMEFVIVVREANQWRLAFIGWV
jgi:hypothetical protein